MFNTLEKFTATCIALLLLAGCQTLSNIIPDALLAPEPPATILAEVAPQSAEATAEVIATPRTAEEQLTELARITSSPAPALTLGKGDVLSVSVYDEPDLTSEALTVRPDGKIAFPLVGQLQVEGRTVAGAEDATPPNSPAIELGVGVRAFVLHRKEALRGVTHQDRAPADFHRQAPSHLDVAGFRDDPITRLIHDLLRPARS